MYFTSPEEYGHHLQGRYSDIDVLTSSFPIPGFGVIPISAFVLHWT